MYRQVVKTWVVFKLEVQTTLRYRYLILERDQVSILPCNFFLLARINFYQISKAWLLYCYCWLSGSRRKQLCYQEGDLPPTEKSRSWDCPSLTGVGTWLEENKPAIEDKSTRAFVRKNFIVWFDPTEPHWIWASYLASLLREKGLSKSQTVFHFFFVFRLFSEMWGPLRYSWQLIDEYNVSTLLKVWIFFFKGTFFPFWIYLVLIIGIAREYLFLSHRG